VKGDECEGTKKKKERERRIMQSPCPPEGTPTEKKRRPY
jgi:hypothetical protein